MHQQLLQKHFLYVEFQLQFLLDKDGKEFARIIGSIDFDDKIFINWLKTYN